MRVQREWAFQAIVDRFIDRVVTPPFWTTALDQASHTTDNARSRARARGVKPGIYDVYVCQAPQRSVWLELKHGKNRPSDAQKAVGHALWCCGIHNAVCYTIQDVATHLQAAGFRLHGNLTAYVQEYQARADAAVAAAEAKAAAKPRGLTAPRKGRTTARDRRSAAIYAENLP